jgi:beta-N-acetylhexosaminidase
MTRLLGALAAALVLVAAPGAAAATPPTTAQLVGQHLMGSFVGTRPDAELLSRIERGELGGILIRSTNVRSRAALASAIAELQAAARRGGHPPLLIAIDQEGGSVKRLRSGPPFQSAAQLGASSDPSPARRAGFATGRYLRSVGVSVDLAPVLDVPGSRPSFFGSRTFGRDPATVARVGVAFAQGVEAAGVAATAKHFPGLGTAPASTDGRDVTVNSSQGDLLRRLAPFRSAVEAGVQLVMVGSARYPALDRTRLPALLSPTIVNGLLRDQLGFHGVVITDTMGGPAVVRFPRAPLRAIRAGVDVLLYSASEQASADGYRILLDAVRTGELRRSTLLTSYDRILRLKAWLRSRA